MAQWCCLRVMGQQTRIKVSEDPCAATKLTEKRQKAFVTILPERFQVSSTCHFEELKIITNENRLTWFNLSILNVTFFQTEWEKNSNRAEKSIVKIVLIRICLQHSVGGALLLTGHFAWLPLAGWEADIAMDILTMSFLVTQGISETFHSCFYDLARLFNFILILSG